MFNLGAPGWLSWLSVRHLILAQVRISQSWDQALHQALCWAWSLLGMCSLSLSLSPAHSLSKKQNNACIHTYIRVYIYIYTCVYIYIYTHTHIYTYIHMLSQTPPLLNTSMANSLEKVSMSSHIGESQSNPTRVGSRPVESWLLIWNNHSLNCGQWDQLKLPSCSKLLLSNRMTLPTTPLSPSSPVCLLPLFPIPSRPSPPKAMH